jgi:gamma-glutamyltranspeptidase
VALTTTINLEFGARLVAGDGIVLNDQMDDFTLPSRVGSRLCSARTIAGSLPDVFRRALLGAQSRACQPV